MKLYKFFTVLLLLMFTTCALTACRSHRGATSAANRPFTVALESVPESMHPWRGADASGDRLRQLMFNSLMRKNERFEYIGDLATAVEVSPDYLTYTFDLQRGVHFHDGREFTAADAKYSLETLLASTTEYKKAPSFFETINKKPVSYIARIEILAPDKLKIVLRKPWNALLSNLVAIAMIPVGSAAQQSTHPIGTGAFSFVAADEANGVYDFRRFDDYWQGAAKLESLRVKVIREATTLQAELRSHRLDFAPSYSPLSPDAYKALSITQGIEVNQFPGANVVYLGFNAEAEFVNNPLVRRAIAVAIDREAIVRDLLLGQARIAHSILPEESWAYFSGTKNEYNPQLAKRLLDQAGFPDPDGDAARMRFPRPIVFKLSSASAVRQYAEVIQNYLKAVGIPVSIETMELTTLLSAQRNGQFQMTTARWVGGNQDPVFLFDLFATKAAFNRGRYSNPQIDSLLREAIATGNRVRALELYRQAQQILSDELPMIPLWYPATMTVARRGVENVKIDASGDFSFMRLVDFKESD